MTSAYVFTFLGVGHGALFAPGGMPVTPGSRCLAEVKPAFAVE
jgi:hypothetical protein